MCDYGAVSPSFRSSLSLISLAKYKSSSADFFSSCSWGLKERRRWLDRIGLVGLGSVSFRFASLDMHRPGYPDSNLPRCPVGQISGELEHGRGRGKTVLFIFYSNFHFSPNLVANHTHISPITHAIISFKLTCIHPIPGDPS